MHHTVGTNDYAPSDSAGIVLGIARYHRDTNGWNDIGYNFLVDKYGQVFEGRAGGIEAAVIGAQAQGYNAQSTGIACLGTFSTVAQSEAGIEALARLIGWKLSLHGVPVQGQVTLTSAGGPSNRYPSGTPVTVNRVCGHRDGDSTSCPGDVLYGQLADLRDRAARYAGPVSGIVVRAASRQHGTTPVNLDGVLHFADGSSPAGASLSVEYTTAGSAWTQVATTTCGPDGTWVTSAVLPSSGKVRAVFAGDSGRPRVESGAITVEVVPKMNLAVDKRRARAGTAFAVSGSMSPAQPRVVCLLERQVRGRWQTVQRKRIAVRNGAYATKVKPQAPGLYRVSIVAVGVTRRRTCALLAPEPARELVRGVGGLVAGLADALAELAEDAAEALRIELRRRAALFARVDAVAALAVLAVHDPVVLAGAHPLLDLRARAGPGTGASAAARRGSGRTCPSPARGRRTRSACATNASRLTACATRCRPRSPSASGTSSSGCG